MNLLSRVKFSVPLTLPGRAAMSGGVLVDAPMRRPGKEAPGT